MEKAIFLAWERAFKRKKHPLRLGNARLQKWRAWQRRSRAFPPSLTPAYTIRRMKAPILQCQRRSFPLLSHLVRCP